MSNSLKTSPEDSSTFARMTKRGATVALGAVLTVTGANIAHADTISNHTAINNVSQNQDDLRIHESGKEVYITTDDAEKILDSTLSNIEALFNNPNSAVSIDKNKNETATLSDATGITKVIKRTRGSIVKYTLSKITASGEELYINALNDNTEVVEEANSVYRMPRLVVVIGDSTTSKGESYVYTDVNNSLSPEQAKAAAALANKIFSHSESQTTVSPSMRTSEKQAVANKETRQELIQNINALPDGLHAVMAEQADKGNVLFSDYSETSYVGIKNPESELTYYYKPDHTIVIHKLTHEKGQEDGVTIQEVIEYDEAGQQIKYLGTRTGFESSRVEVIAVNAITGAQAYYDSVVPKKSSRKDLTMLNDYTAEALVNHSFEPAPL